MQLGFISPKKYLVEIDGQGTLSFALGHIALEDKKYREYFADRAAEGRLVMLDNGCWELGEPISNKCLIDMVREIRPTEVYSPDYIDDPDRTIASIKEFSILLKRSRVTSSSGEPVRLVGVVQGNRLEEWLGCYEALVDHPDIDTIAVPVTILEDFATNEDERTRWGMTRLRLMRAIHEKYGFTKTIHLTGLDFPFELADPLYKHPLVRSNDCKSPIVHGKFKIKFHLKGEHWPGKIRSAVYGRDFFDWELSQKEMFSVKYNMKVIKSYVNGIAHVNT